MSDYHLLGLVLVPVIGAVAAFIIVFLCKSIDLCLPSGPGPYAHLAGDTQGRSRRGKRRRQKESEVERGASSIACTPASGEGPSMAPTDRKAGPMAAMAAMAPMPPRGPAAPMRPLCGAYS